MEDGLKPQPKKSPTIPRLFNYGENVLYKGIRGSVIQTFIESDTNDMWSQSVEVFFETGGSYVFDIETAKELVKMT